MNRELSVDFRVSFMDLKTRIDGWKLIAAYLKRERTTVMRWARDRGLPVHRVPGEGGGSVFAYVQELDAWFAKSRDGIKAMSDEVPPDQNDDAELEPVAAEFEPVDVGPTLPAFVAPTRRWLIPGLVALGLVGLGVGISQLRPSSTPTKTVGLPADPEAAALFVKACADWEARTAQSLHAAVTGFTAVTNKAPNFAPGFARLADAYLLVREFDATPDSIAYPRARDAANRALDIDQNAPEAHRALAFIAYWWERDIPKARASFARALRLDPRGAQTHFWFGNCLVDNGETTAGLEELKLAQTIEPASEAIKSDYGWALWTAGKHDEAQAYLKAMLSANQLSGPLTYLSYISLLKGDWAGYFDFNTQRMQKREDRTSVQRVEAEKKAFSAGGAKAVLDFMIGAVTVDTSAANVDSSWRTSLAALSDDRPRLLGFLREAEQRREVWGLAGFVGPAFAHWSQDGEISALLARRKGSTLL